MAPGSDVPAPFDLWAFGRAFIDGPAWNGASLDELRHAYDDLVARYAEPHRRYHTGEHVAEVLAEIDRLAPTLVAAPEGGADPVAVVRVAAYFHDAVYDPAASTGASEAASAQLAASVLRSFGREPGMRATDEGVVAEVDRLIRLTVDHEVRPGDPSGALLLDADLWILSSPALRYDRYADDVRAEYAHVPDALWASGRGAVLQRFLDGLDGLYRAGDADDQAARRARAAENLRRELGALGA